MLKRWLLPKDRKDPPSWKGEFERTCMTQVVFWGSQNDASDLRVQWSLGYYMGTTVICFSLRPKFGIKTLKWVVFSCPKTPYIGNISSSKFSKRLWKRKIQNSEFALLLFLCWAAWPLLPFGRCLFKVWTFIFHTPWHGTVMRFRTNAVFGNVDWVGTVWMISHDSQGIIWQKYWYIWNAADTVDSRNPAPSNIDETL